MTDNDFLPDDYKAPSGNYMKLQPGENRIRILQKPILGWEGWKDKKPYRFRMEERPVTTGFDNQMVKHFWAFVCWDYADKAIKILEITQASIQKAVEAVARNADWGPPYNYDLSITRSGADLETKYTIVPIPPSPISKQIQEALISNPCRIEALYDGDDPFDISPEEAPVSDLSFGEAPPPTEADIPA